MDGNIVFWFIEASEGLVMVIPLLKKKFDFSELRLTPKSAHTKRTQNLKAVPNNDFVWETNPRDALRVDILLSECAATRAEARKIQYAAIPVLDVEVVDEIEIPVVNERSFSPGNDEENDSLPARMVDFVLNKASAPRESIQGLSLGIISDSKIYSAMIKSEVEPQMSQVRHFNHPNSFTPDRYGFFDSISAWIIFLSEDDSSDFFDRFHERYEDKPTLLLFEKMKRKQASEKIAQFMAENGFSKA
jgi:hypothetical protein